MSECSFVDYINLKTPHRSEGRSGNKISRITIHHAAGICTFDTLTSITMSKQASWNYAIDKDGKIGLYVSEQNRAWTSSDSYNDNRAVTIEVSNSTLGPEWRISDKVYATLLVLCEDICRRHDIKELTFTGQLAGSNLTAHRWFASTLCPGPYLYSKFPDIAKTVSTRIKIPGGSPQLIEARKNGSNAIVSAAYLNATDAESAINTSVLSPYVITLSEKSPDIDWSKLKDKQISGAMIECGRYYNAAGIGVGMTGYRSSKLRHQVDALVAANIPYGFVHPITSRKVSQCEDELDALRQVVRLYAPPLGVWLRLNLYNDKTTNDRILDNYLDYLTKHAGLKNMLGIVATRSQLKQISWEEKHHNNFLLWLDDKLDGLNNMDELLTPNFFNVCD